MDREANLVFVTSNMNKLREARKLLGMQIKNANLELREVQSLSVKEVAGIKAREAYRILKKPVMVEDTGLYIRGFGGFPGALVKWTTNGVGYEGVCRLVDSCRSRDAYAETCVALCDGKSVKRFVGRIEGSIAMEPKGSRNFGWDYIFIPKGSAKTFAEMSVSEKNKVSMRRVAFSKLLHFLSEKSRI
jgi:XTP/dITP diphosphohydrolase